MNTLQRSLLFVTMTATFFLAACGGGGDSATTSTPSTGTPTTQSPPSTPTGVDFLAFGSSASTVSLGWARPAGSATYAIERKTAGGDWAAVASVDALGGTYVDSGLTALTDYSYRLVEVGATPATLAERTTKTSDELPVITAPGAALADAVIHTLGATGGQVASPDGAIVAKVPAGAFAADANATAQPVTNTAPDGRGNGLKLVLGTMPAAPLTLTLRYDAAEDGEADVQRIAVQRADGNWISLPLAAQDKTARTLTAELPPSLIAAPAGARAAPAGVRAAATTSSAQFTVVRYLGFTLRPPQAQVEVKKSLGLVPYARVRGYTAQDNNCRIEDDAVEICPLIPKPVLETREIKFLNDKAGFVHRWMVDGVEGGNSTHGTVAAGGIIGATFNAPASVPDPATVTVSFQSRHAATGRTVTMSSKIKITDGRWTGTMTSENGPSDAGTTLFAKADVSWQADDEASTDTNKVYRATGDVDVVVADDDCTVSVSPSRQPVATNRQLVELAVDESRSPMTYTAHVITFWPATLSASCPGKGSDTRPTLAGYGWDVSGVVSADGRRIEGKMTDENGAKIEWLFTR